MATTTLTRRTLLKTAAVTTTAFAMPFVHRTYAAAVLVAATVVLIPRVPLGLLTTAVQALAGILLPSATVFLLLLCNDREVLGPWTNPMWLNVVATVIVSVLLELSLILVVTTLAPSIDVGGLLVFLSVLLVVGLTASGVWLWRSRFAIAAGPPPVPLTTRERESWRMPPLALLNRPEWSPARKVAMLALQAYLVLTVILLVVKAVQLAVGP